MRVWSEKLWSFNNVIKILKNWLNKLTLQSRYISDCHGYRGNRVSDVSQIKIFFNFILGHPGKLNNFYAK